MEIFWQELTSGLPDGQQFVRVVIRLITAVALGSIVGYEREKAGKAAGLRTHMLVSLGTCLFILACAGSGMDSDGLSRLIQGIVTGIGFLGAGTILKINEERNIQGLTTAAGIWMTAAIGVAVGLGELGMAFLGAILTVVVLAFLGKIEYRSEDNQVVKNEKD